MPLFFNALTTNCQHTLETPKKNGVTPAYIAAEQGHVKVLKLFKEWGVNLETPENNGVTPAYIATQKGYVAVLELFNKWGISLEIPTKIGATPAFIAAQEGQVAVLKLFNKWGINLEIPTKSGTTAAFIAAQEGNLAILELFNKWGVNLGTPTNNGVTPMFIAAQQGHLEVIKYLVRVKQKTSIPVIASRQDLIDLFEKQNDNTEEIVKRMRSKIEERMEKGDNASAIKLLPLDIAWVIGHNEVADYLSDVHDNSTLSSASIQEEGPASAFPFFSSGEKQGNDQAPASLSSSPS